MPCLSRNKKVPGGSSSAGHFLSLSICANHIRKLGSWFRGLVRSLPNLGGYYPPPQLPQIWCKSCHLIENNRFIVFSPSRSAQPAFESFGCGIAGSSDPARPGGYYPPLKCPRFGASLCIYKKIINLLHAFTPDRTYRKP